RRLCSSCKLPTTPDPAHLHLLGLPAAGAGAVFRARGCEACRGTGFQGRLAIYELCLLTPALQHLINRRAHPHEFYRQAVADGYMPRRLYGWQKVLAGEPTLEEVLSVTAAESSPDGEPNAHHPTP